MPVRRPQKVTLQKRKRKPSKAVELRRRPSKSVEICGPALAPRPLASRFPLLAGLVCRSSTVLQLGTPTYCLQPKRKRTGIYNSTVKIVSSWNPQHMLFLPLSVRAGVRLLAAGLFLFLAGLKCFVVQCLCKSRAPPEIGKSLSTGDH